MLNNILQYLDETARRVPAKLAFSDGRVGSTFGELDDGSRRAGSALLRRGYGREPVAILMERSPAEITAFMGVIRAGCFYAALDAAMPEARMQQILATLETRVLLCDSRNLSRAEQLAASLPSPLCVLSYEDLVAEEIDEGALAAVRETAIDQDPIYVVFTSGSTGVPKGVVACHRSVIDYTESLCEAIGFTEKTVFANQTPLYFDAPLKEIMPTLKYGATTYLVPRMLFSFPIPLCDFLNRYKVNTICWVVSALTMISSFGVLEKNPPRYLTTVCFGSEVFPRPQYDLWRAALPNARFFNLYGPTEATGMSCYWTADRALEPDEPIPVGRPFRNTDILLLGTDEAGKPRRILPTEPDMEGEICMRGTCVTLGYYNDPTRTAEAFRQNPLQCAYPETIYCTGDLGRYNRHGELVFVCRRDAQIKILGHRVEPGEIEAAAAPAVREGCCVYDAPRTRLVLYYAAEVCTPDDLRRLLAAHLPRYMMPAVIKRLEALPHTPNGKLDRKSLREQAEIEP